MQGLLPYVINGISAGGQYALIAIGYTLVYGILRLINFAHGDVFMVAGLIMVYASASLPMYLAIPLVLVLTALLGFERSLELCRHKIDSVAGGLELIRLRVVYGIVEIARANAVNAADKSIERLGNVSEQLAREVNVRENDGQQQRRADRSDIYPHEGLKALKQIFVLLDGDVQVI